MHHPPPPDSHPDVCSFFPMASFSQRSNVSLDNSQRHCRPDLIDFDCLFSSSLPHSMSAATRRLAHTNKRTNVECARGTTRTVAPWSWRSPRRPKRTVIIYYMDTHQQLSSSRVIMLLYMAVIIYTQNHSSRSLKYTSVFCDWTVPMSHTVIKQRPKPSVLIQK